jgi:hypothetical protein
MDSSQFRKYSFYALGEILLVMVGILLALQVNNWNEERRDRKQEQTILSNLRDEFKLNRNVLVQKRESYMNSYDAGLSLMDLVAQPESTIRTHNTDSLLFWSIEHDKYAPTENALDDLLQSGRLQLIRNPTLKNLLYEWSNAVQEYQQDFETADLHAKDYVVPYLSRNYSMKDLDRYGPLQWPSGTALKVDKLAIFQDIEFENLLDDQLYRKKNLLSSLDTLEEIILALLNEVE